MTTPEIPDEAVEAAARALQPTAGNHDLRCPTYSLRPFLECTCAIRADAKFRARVALEAALPHLRVQETPMVDRQTLALLLTDIVGTLDKGEEWYIADRILALTRLPSPHPRPVVDREALLKVLRSNLTVNEYGEVSGVGTSAAADAVLALLATEEETTKAAADGV